LIPAAAYLILAEQTRRLCSPDVDDSGAIRRVIRKLVLHFAGSSLSYSYRRIAELNLQLVAPTDPETYALRCLAAVAQIVREAQQDESFDASLDLLPQINDTILRITETLTGGADAH
jgi:hypothetical protein